MPKTKSAFALWELAKIFSQNKLGIVARYMFIRGDDEKESNATQEIDTISVLCRKYFKKKISPDEVKIQTSRIKTFFERERILQEKINDTTTRITRHIERLKTLEVFLANDIFNDESNFIQTKKRMFEKISRYLGIYAVILDNLNSLKDSFFGFAHVRKNLTSKEISKIIGDNLKQARIQAGLTQVDAAKQLGIAQTKLSAYERGTLAPPLSVIRNSFFVYDLSLEWLFGLAIEQ